MENATNFNAEQKPGDSNYCFACGKNNPIGLHLHFHEEDGKYVTTKVLPKEYQSYNGIVHGGILTTLMDESMGNYLFEKEGKPALTARMEVKYHHQTPVEQPLTISSWVESERRGLIKMHAEVALADGTVTAESEAVFMLAKEH